MKGKTVKESAITSSHLMLIKHSGNFIFDAGKTIPMVHGGILMTLMQFVSPAFAGNRMILKSSVNYTTKTSMEIGIRIEAEDMKNGTVKHTNSCYLVAVAINDAGKPMEIPAIIPETEDEKRRFNDARIRNEERLRKRIKN